METYLDCLPFFMRQALDSARMATPDREAQETVLHGILNTAASIELDLSPPVMGQQIHQAIYWVASAC